jgi:hypothetical protein
MVIKVHQEVLGHQVLVVHQEVLGHQEVQDPLELLDHQDQVDQVEVQVHLEQMDQQGHQALQEHLGLMEILEVRHSRIIMILLLRVIRQMVILDLTALHQQAFQK